jgi:UDP-N-acetylglucosamine--N-acetylmuramyl-(pentapeptide) pyrophosphoryl-undecaprenol N-acetylglucosamine transferase
MIKKEAYMRLLITGGGTGGHIYPGLAVARELLARGPEHNVVWVGARRGLESSIVPREGIRFAALGVTGLKGKGTLYRIGSLARLAAAFTQALWILRREKPDVALGVGGYASGPMGLAALASGVPLAIAEQNAAPGFTNRWLGKGAAAVFTSWPGSEKYFPQGGVRLAGNPVRKEFAMAGERAPDGRFHVLIIGGSQGAAPINRAAMDAAAHLIPLASAIRVVHQTGERDAQTVRDAAATTGLDWETSAFYEDMDKRIASADLVISRSGAGAVAEICAVGRAAVYIPFPLAADDHQTLNALPAVRDGAAIILKESHLTGATLAQLIIEMEKERGRLADMAARAKSLGRPDAAARIVDGLLALAAEAA